MLNKKNRKEGLGLTISYRPSRTGDGYIGYVNEVPGAASQGTTIEELKENLWDAVFAIFKSNRDKIDNEIMVGDGVETDELQPC